MCSAALTLALACSLIVLGAPAGAQTTGTLSGAVTAAESGTGLGGITVEIYQAYFGVLVTTTGTAPDGTWTAPDLVPTDYRIRYIDPTGDRAERWSGNATSWPTSTARTVTADTTTTDDATMTLLGDVTGTITAAGGGPVPDATVALLNAQGWAVRTTTTASDGTYSFDGVAAGAFRLVVGTNGTYGTVYWPDATAPGAATVLDVPAGGTLVADQVVHPAGQLTGTITVTGLPTAGMYAGALHPGTVEIVAIAPTGGDGTFSIGGLPPGSFKIIAVDPLLLSQPAEALRPEAVPDLDILSDAFAAFSGATTFTVGAGAATPVGTADLAGADCNPTVMYPGAGLAGTDLADADLRGCDLTGADLTGADLRRADLTAADLTGVAATSARFSTNPTGFGALTPPTDLATLDRTVITGADLELAAVQPWQLAVTDPDWTGADLRATRSRYGCSVSFQWGWCPAPVFGDGITATDGGAFVPLTTGAGVAITGAPYDLRQVLVASANVGSMPGEDLTGFGCRACNLTGRSFAGATLTDADLFDATLQNVDLSGADLAGADLGKTVSSQGASMAGAVLTGADLAGASLRGRTTLTPAQLASASHNLSGTDLSDTKLNLSGWNLAGDGYLVAGARLATVTLGTANVAGLDLTGTDVSRVDLRNVIGLTAAQFGGTAPNWTSTDLTGKAFDLSGACPSGPLVAANAKLDHVSFAGCDFTDADLSGADLTGATLTGTTLTDASIAGTDLTDATGLTTGQLLSVLHDWRSTDLDGTGIDLSGIDFAAGGYALRGTDLSGADLSGSSFVGLDLTAVGMRGTTLTGVDLTGATIRAARLDDSVGLGGATLTATTDDWTSVDLSGSGVDLSGQDLRAKLLEYTDLSGIDLTGADLRGVDANRSIWAGAVLAGTRISGIDLFIAKQLTGAQVLAADHDWSGANFTGTGLNLSGTDFAGGGYTLVDARLVGVNLTGANLAGMDLRGVNFTSSTLTGATMTGATIAGALLVQTTGLTGAQVLSTDTDWTGTAISSSVNLTGADLTGHTLIGAALGANLTNANLTGVDLTGGGLSGNLTGATLTGAVLDDASVSGANFRDVIGLTMGQLASTKRSLWATVLYRSGVTFIGANLRGDQGWMFPYANLTGLNLSGADATGTSFAYAVLNSTQLVGTTFASANLSQADLLWANATNADFSGADLSDADLRLATVTGADLTGANLSRANLKSANFTGATGTPTGGSTAIYSSTRCPDGVTTNGTTILTCVGHGFAP